MYLGSLTFGGVEIANHARLYTYAQALLGDDVTVYRNPVCTAIHNPTSYVTPTADGAPWYDAARPETARFCGLLIENMTGLADPWGQVPVGQSPLGGGKIGARRRSARQVTVSGLLLGADPAAVQAGLEWLTRVLSGDGATTVYDGLVDAVFYSACPPNGQAAADYQRTLTRVLCTDGPSTGAWFPGGYGIEVRFQLTAEVPEVHWPSASVATNLAPSGKHAAEYFCCHELAFQPGITPPPPAGAPSWSPFDEPWWTSRVSTTITHAKPWELALSATVYAGASELRNARLTLYRLTGAQNCPTHPVDLAVECGQVEACIEIPWMPAGSRLAIDAARRRVTLTSGGVTYDGRRYVTASQNGPLRYPVVPAGAAKACLVFAQDYGAQSAGILLESVTSTRRSLSVG